MSLSSKSVRAAAVSAGLAFSCVLLFPVHAYSLESTADPIGTGVCYPSGFRYFKYCLG